MIPGISEQKRYCCGNFAFPVELKFDKRLTGEGGDNNPVVDQNGGKIDIETFGLIESPGKMQGIIQEFN
jgi:hypothetical protein